MVSQLLTVLRDKGVHLCEDDTQISQEGVVRGGKETASPDRHLSRLCGDIVSSGSWGVSELGLCLWGVFCVMDSNSLDIHSFPVGVTSDPEQHRLIKTPRIH